MLAIRIAAVWAVAAGAALAQQAAPIEWSADRRLTWSDFAGRPQLGTDASAMTSYVIQFENHCQDEVLTWRVTSVFQPDKSWVRAGLILRAAESRRMLAHEQTHFDLSEANVRRLRRALTELAKPCAMTGEARNDLALRFVREDVEMQQRYDLETAWGQNERRQNQWDADVAKQLAALARWAQ